MTLLGAPARGEIVAERSARPTTGSYRLGVPFVALHLACISVFFVGWSATALVVAAVSYIARTFGITAFYHRCFSHRAFRVSRALQLLGAVVGAAAAQRGPLWWVAHHRMHHKATDREGDPHSPVTLGFLTAHVLWIFAPANRETVLERVPDLARFPELRLLDRFNHVVPVLLGAFTYGLGALISSLDPALRTSGPQLLVWGFVLPTVLLYHSTFAVNSVAHRFGSRRFDTNDNSRNNWIVATLTLGEGWHNNHHQYPNCARQGLARREIDPTWCLVRALELAHLATDVRRAPARILAAARTRPVEPAASR